MNTVNDREEAMSLTQRLSAVVKTLALVALVLAGWIAAPSLAQQLYFVHTDHIDTPRLITNGAGVTVWMYDPIDPFAADGPDEDPSGLGTFTYNIRFPGQYLDRETWMHYNYHRHYDQETGRYVESDPIGLAGGLNTYAYVGGNPISFTDPSGLNPLFGLLLRLFGIGAAATSVANDPVPILGGGLICKVTNPVPGTMARVIPAGVPATTLGRPGAADVMTTVADDIAGMNAAGIAQRLGIPPSPNGYQVIQFPTPQSGVASPVFRTDPGFVGGGLTSGGAREFVIPNQPIPSGATTRIVR